MPKPKGKRAAGKARRAAPAKAAAKTRRPKARVAKPIVRQRRVVAPKKKTRGPAKPAPSAARPATPSVAAPALKAAPSVTRTQRKEATSMADQAKCPIHNSPDCYKPALDAYIQKAYDGYCTKIDWPFVRIIPKGWKPGS